MNPLFHEDGVARAITIDESRLQDSCFALTNSMISQAKPRRIEVLSYAAACPTLVTADLSTQLNRALAGQYEILHEIGGGGHAITSDAIPPRRPRPSAMCRASP